MAWMDKTRNKIVLGGAIVLTVVVVTLLVLAIPSWGPLHRGEGGLLEVCWGPSGEAQYVDGTEGATGPCEGPEELVWPQKQVPLTVAASSATGIPSEDSSEVRVLKQTVSDINAQVGYELMRVGPGLHPSDGIVHFGQPIESDPRLRQAPGFVAHRRSGGVLRGDIYIRSDVVPDRLLFLVLRHELLHFAGLEHDDFPGSVMYDFTRDDSIEGQMSTAHVTDYDRGPEGLGRYRR